ncbi:MAG: phosphatidylserine decarboxylase family protein [Nitrospiraceae bacterium]|nr:MAG: phosphatidylserine decarboxylase family protein [Nitrospiraceae bacterium]
MVKLAPEGYPFILFFAVLAIVTSFFGNFVLTAVPLSLTLFMIFFFRDPERKLQEDRDIFYAPADGKVIAIKETDEQELLNQRALEISIFMSPLDVHVNRSPCDGTVKEVKHYPGKFRAAFRGDSSLSNEHITMLLDTGHGEIVVRQVAGFLARRAVCRVKLNDLLKQGQRYGIIKFSSRVDVFLPLSARARVSINDRVKAGESVIAEINNS